MKKYIHDSKHRAFLKGRAMQMDPIFAVGKNSLTPEMIEAVSENIAKHELIKISILKNCDDDPKELAYTLAERTGSELVQLIGRKIVLYKPAKEEKNRRYETAKKAR